MHSVAIPTKLYLRESKQISNWLYENKIIIHSSIKHPVSNYYNLDPRIIITFDDPEMAMMFKLMWG